MSPSIHAVIVDAIINYGMSHPSPRDIADHVCERIIAAGYDIVGPGEYHERTREAAAKVADAHQILLYTEPGERLDDLPKFAVSRSGQVIAAAIRAMKPEAKGE